MKFIVHFVPYRLPGLRDRIIARSVQSPLDYERRIISAVYGTHQHGAFLSYQVGAMRPIPEFGSYRSAIKSLSVRRRQPPRLWRHAGARTQRREGDLRRPPSRSHWARAAFALVFAILLQYYLTVTKPGAPFIEAAVRCSRASSPSSPTFSCARPGRCPGFHLTRETRGLLHAAWCARRS